MKDQALRAKDVERRLAVSRATAIRIMAQLGAANVSAPGSKHRSLRLREDTLEAFLRGGGTTGTAATEAAKKRAKAAKTKQETQPQERIIAFRPRNAERKAQ